MTFLLRMSYLQLSWVCTFTNKCSPSFSVLMILCAECCETSAQISVGRSKLKDKCSKTLMCILSSMPSRADKSIKWQRKATSIMFDRFTGWGLTCHRAVIYSLALLHRKGWGETSLTLKQFCAEGHWWDEKNAKFLKISSTAGCLGKQLFGILLAGLLFVVQLWCDNVCLSVLKWVHPALTVWACRFAADVLYWSNLLVTEFVDSKLISVLCCAKFTCCSPVFHTLRQNSR